MGGLARWWGPVFEAERTTRVRRWHGFALRSLFVLGLLIGLALAWIGAEEQVGAMTVEQMAEIGSGAFYTLTSFELLGILLVAPAATAGAICLDKSRGALTHVFVTDLTNREIIVGKLAARLVPVGELLACTIPVLAMVGLLGGVAPTSLAIVVVVSIGLAVLGCSFALMLSVWASKPHEVLSVVFAVWTIWLVGWPVMGLMGKGAIAVSPELMHGHPFFVVMMPYYAPDEVSILAPILFSLACLLVGAGFTFIAIRKVRVVGCRSSRVGARRTGWLSQGLAWVCGQIRWARGPSLDGNPVLWREWHRNRPSRWSKIVWVGFALVCTGTGMGMVADQVIGWNLLINQQIAAAILALEFLFGLLLVSTTTASVLADERARGSLDVLMTTPVSTRMILQAKWWGAFRRVPWLAFWPAVVGVAQSATSRIDLVRLGIFYLVPLLIMVQGAMLVSIGLALATWIKRAGQATAWTIALLVITSIGPLVADELLPVEQWSGLTAKQSVLYLVLADSLAMSSPLYNVGAALAYALDPGTATANDLMATLILMITWTLIHAVIAWALFEVTVRTFDRCLGRVPAQSRARATPPRQPSRPPASSFEPESALA